MLQTLPVAMVQKQPCCLCHIDQLPKCYYYSHKTSISMLEEPWKGKRLDIDLLKLYIWGIKIWEILGPMLYHQDYLIRSMGGNQGRVLF